MSSIIKVGKVQSSTGNDAIEIANSGAINGLKIADGGNIGSASDTDAISISSSGAVTLSSDFVPATPLSHRNMIINGAMQVAQRGTSAITATDSYPVDRFVSSFGANGSFSLQQVSESPADFNYSIKWTVTGTDTSLAAGQYAYIRTILEGQDIAHLNWGSSDARTVTLSFYIKSSVTGTFGGAIWNSAFDRSYPFTYTVSGTDWERKSITIPGDTTGTWLTNNMIGMSISPLASAGTTYSASAGSWIADGKVTGTGATNIMNGSSATYHVTGVQLELGSVATPFEYRSFPDELRRCQRYYERTYNYGTATGAGSDGSAMYAGALFAGLNGTGGTTNGWLHAQFRDQVEKRAVPTTTLYDTAGNVGKLSLTVPGTSTTPDKTAGVGDVSANSISVYRSSGTSDSAASFYCHLLRDAEL